MRSRSPLTLIIIDIDYFKEYNDFYGHAAGDACIKQIAQTLRRALPRKTDLLARYGGDEFACILPETNAAGALNVAEQLHTAVKRLQIRHIQPSQTGTVTLSMGIATAEPAPGSQVLTLIESADACLYESKNNGRNQTRSIDLGRLGC